MLFWCFWQDTGKVTEALRERVADWGEIRRTPFSPLGADVPSYSNPTWRRIETESE